MSAGKEAEQVNRLKEADKLAFEVLRKLDPTYTFEAFLEDRARIRKVLRDLLRRYGKG